MGRSPLRTAFTKEGRCNETRVFSTNARQPPIAATLSIRPRRRHNLFGSWMSIVFGCDCCRIEAYVLMDCHAMRGEANTVRKGLRLVRRDNGRVL